MQNEGSLTFSQQPATGPELAESISLHLILIFFKKTFEYYFQIYAQVLQEIPFLQIFP
jgi:hypothetical protein